MKKPKKPDVKAIMFKSARKVNIKYFVNKLEADKIDDIVEFTINGHGLFLKIENSEKLTIAMSDRWTVLSGGS